MGAAPGGIAGAAPGTPVVYIGGATCKPGAPCATRCGGGCTGGEPGCSCGGSDGVRPALGSAAALLGIGGIRREALSAGARVLVSSGSTVVATSVWVSTRPGHGE